MLGSRRDGRRESGRLARRTGKAYSAAAVSWDSGADAPDSSSVVHPNAFPTHGTLVIEVFFAPDRHQMTGSLSFMAIGHVPTCALPG